jgi:DMSO/TMAO reductase YedYZ molybdopterin-dependent catalytic subunit
MNSTTTTRASAPVWAGALAGLLSAAAGVGVGSGVAALLRGVPSPVESVGNRAIDYAPPFLKDFAVRQFGTDDKPILIAGVVATLAVAAMVAGAIGTRRLRIAIAVVTLIGLVAVAAAAIDRTTTASRAVTLIPSVLTLLVSLALLVILLGEINLGRAGDELPPGFDRRRFLAAAVGAGAIVVVGLAVGRFFGSAAAAASRAGIRLPRPSDPAGAVPPGAQVDVEGVSPYVTPNRDFYRIDTALRVPDVPAEGWSLRVHGMVDRELDISYRDLMRMPLVERRITLTCVSNEVGGPYVGNAAWIGVPVRDLLDRAGVQDRADAVKTTSADRWTCGTPLEAVTSDDRNALIAIGMNGEPLPLAHGFPARMVVPGLYGYVSATKWLTDLEVTRFADFKAYWTTRDYDAEAPIKFSSRIDVPKSFQAFPKDKVRVGGVAWAQAVGIANVEVRVDKGDWQLAELGTEDGIETWRQWSWRWDEATAGTHTLTVRATTKDGETQTSDRARIRPNGTTGWHSVQFRVE